MIDTFTLKTENEKQKKKRAVPKFRLQPTPLAGPNPTNSSSRMTRGKRLLTGLATGKPLAWSFDASVFVESYIPLLTWGGAGGGGEIFMAYLVYQWWLFPDPTATTQRLHVGREG